jgi:hypothetical protein
MVFANGKLARSYERGYGGAVAANVEFALDGFGKGKLARSYERGYGEG